LTAVFGGNGSLSMSTSNAVSQVVSPSAAVAPTVTNTQRFGFHQQPTTLVLTFSAALTATPAQNVSNYQIMTLGGPGRGGSNVGHITPVTSAVYNATAHTVTLSPSQRLDVHNRYQLTVTGTVPGGLVGSTGLPLNGSGKSGTDYVTVITRSTLAGSAPAVISVHGLHSKVRPSAHAVDALAASGHLSVKSVRHPHSAGP
jgi:type VI secretion system secreted protein VgrG